MYSISMHNIENHLQKYIGIRPKDQGLIIDLCNETNQRNVNIL